MVEEWRAQTCKTHGGPADGCGVDAMKQWLSANASEWYNDDREYASLIEKFYPLPLNRRKFIETEVAEKTPSIGYAYLVRLAEAGFLRTIFTTNFDDLLNEAFYQFSSQRALVCAHDSSVQTISVTSRRTKIIKLHGDYLFDDLKNTSRETQDLEENMKAKLREFLKEYGIIIVGYSGSDRSITRPLNDMSGEALYLRNGLFWCFRAEDEITPQALEILERPNSFFVLTSGFDELMADFYSLLGTDVTPFNSKLASDRASHIIDTYLQSVDLKTTASPTIKAHLEALEAERSASLLSDLIVDLNAEKFASSGLSDKNWLVYLEIERALKGRNPEVALARLRAELKTAERKFKEMLLRQQFWCSLRLANFAEARAVAGEMLNMDGANFYVALNECSLIENRSERLDYLDRLKQQHPFCAPVLNQYSHELYEALERRDKIKGPLGIQHVTTCLEQSLILDPSLSNQAHSQLFNVLARHAEEKKREKLEKIVDKHLAQDAFSLETSAMLLRYCRKFRTPEYKGRQLLEYLMAGYENHFPRDYASHLEIIVEACVEFNEQKLLRPVLERVREDEEVRDNPQYATTIMDVYYDVFRHLSQAIAFGHEFLRRKRKPAVELKLLELCIANGNPQKARELHTKLRGAIGCDTWLEYEAKILESETHYQDAIDTIQRIPDRRNFEERFTAHLAYLELKMGSPARAFKRCKEFLTPRSFSLAFETVIVNYEYAKEMDGRKVDKERIANLAKYSENEMVKAVCHSLLRDDEECLKIIRQEAEKRFSRIDHCLDWPAVSRHREALVAMRTDLLKARRSLTELV